MRAEIKSSAKMVEKMMGVKVDGGGGRKHFSTSKSQYLPGSKRQKLSFKEKSLERRFFYVGTSYVDKKQGVKLFI
jgi:hypothetical protein